MLLNQTNPMWSLPAIWTTLLSILMLFLWLPCKASMWLLINSQVWFMVRGRKTDFSSYGYGQIGCHYVRIRNRMLPSSVSWSAELSHYT